MAFTQKFTNTDQIIDAFKQNKLPNQIMFTFHPQRWNDNLVKWFVELNNQNVKNLVKRLLISVRK
jgi:GH35 family endo-1,4-beta-xylanase